MDLCYFIAMIYVISPKNAYSSERLKYEAGIMSAKGGSAFGGNYLLKVIDLKWLMQNDFNLPCRRGDVLYIRNPYLNGKADYLPKIIKMAKTFKLMGGKVVDANIVEGEIGKGKWEDYRKLKKAGVSIPKTWKYELGIRNYGGNLSPNLLALSPIILKWIYGMKAKGTFLISSEKDLRKIPSSIPKKELMVQEFIKAKYEYKVITVGYKALPVVLRFETMDSGFRANFEHYKVIKSQTLPKLIQIAQKSAKVLGRELSKVDILEDYKGKLYVLEVNRFPGLESFEKLTKHNVYGEFLEFLRK